MKRFVLAVAVVSSLNAFVPASAACVAGGEYDTVYIKAGNVEILGYQFGNFATGPVKACTDGNAGAQPNTGALEIRVDGSVVCHRDDVRVSADPFGFGIGIHATPGSCGTDVSLGLVVWPSATPETVTGAYPPASDPAGGDASGVNAGLLFASPATGKYWLGNGDVTLPAGQFGWYTRGAKVVLS